MSAQVRVALSGFPLFISSPSVVYSKQMRLRHCAHPFQVLDNDRSLMLLPEMESVGDGVRGRAANRGRVRMRVGFISHLSEMSGAEIAMMELIEGLMARGVECQLVVPGPGRLVEECNSRGVVCHNLPDTLVGQHTIALGEELDESGLAEEPTAAERHDRALKCLMVGYVAPHKRQKDAIVAVGQLCGCSSSATRSPDIGRCLTG